MPEFHSSWRQRTPGTFLATALAGNATPAAVRAFPTDIHGPGGRQGRRSTLTAARISSSPFPVESSEMALMFRPTTVPSRRACAVPADEVQLSLTVCSLKPSLSRHAQVPQYPDSGFPRAHRHFLPPGRPILTPTGPWLSMSRGPSLFDRSLSRRPHQPRRPISAPQPNVYLQTRSLALPRAHFRPQSAQRITCSYSPLLLVKDTTNIRNDIRNRTNGEPWLGVRNEDRFETGDLGTMEDYEWNEYEHNGVGKSVSATSKRESLTVFVPVANPALDEDSESEQEVQVNSRQEEKSCPVPRLNLQSRPNSAPDFVHRTKKSTKKREAKEEPQRHRFKLTRPRSSIIKTVRRGSTHSTMDATNSTPRAPPPSPEKPAQRAATLKQNCRTKSTGTRRGRKKLSQESNVLPSPLPVTATHSYNGISQPFGRMESADVFQNGEDSSVTTDGSSNADFIPMDDADCGEDSVFVNREDVMDGSEEKGHGGQTNMVTMVDETVSEVDGLRRTDERFDDSNRAGMHSVAGEVIPNAVEQAQKGGKEGGKTGREAEFGGGDERTDENEEEEDDETPRAPHSMPRIEVKVRRRPVSAPPCVEEAKQTPRPIVIPVATTYDLDMDHAHIMSQALSSYHRHCSQERAEDMMRRHRHPQASLRRNGVLTPRPPESPRTTATASPRPTPRPWSALPQKFDTGNISLKHLSEANVLEKERGNRRVLNVRTITLDIMEPGEAPITKAAAYIRRNRTTHSWNMSQSFPSASFLHHHMQMQHHHHGRSPSSLSPSSQTPPSSLSSPRVVKAKEPSKRPSSAYAYDGGFFTPCSPRRDWFVIHPDWVSDAMAVQKMSLTDRQDRPDGASERKSRGQSWPSRRCKSAPPPKRRNPITWAD